MESKIAQCISVPADSGDDSDVDVVTITDPVFTALGGDAPLTGDGYTEITTTTVVKDEPFEAAFITDDFKEEYSLPLSPVSHSSSASSSSSLCGGENNFDDLLSLLEGNDNFGAAWLKDDITDDLLTSSSGSNSHDFMPNSQFTNETSLNTSAHNSSSNMINCDDPFQDLFPNLI